MSLESPDGRRPRVLDDAAAMRAFAHPVRLALHEILLREGPATAADAARQAGISQALASYHLRQLAKYGFVEQAEARDERERPWKVTEPVQVWSEADAPDVTAARGLLEQVIAERAMTRLLEWQQRRREEPEAWRGAGSIGNVHLYATPEELQELGNAMSALLEPLMARVFDPARRPAGSRPVLLSQILVPLPPSGSGG